LEEGAGSARVDREREPRESGFATVGCATVAPPPKFDPLFSPEVNPPPPPPCPAAAAVSAAPVGGDVVFFSDRLGLGDFTEEEEEVSAVGEVDEIGWNGTEAAGGEGATVMEEEGDEEEENEEEGFIHL